MQCERCESLKTVVTKIVEADVAADVVNQGLIKTVNETAVIMLRISVQLQNAARNINRNFGDQENAVMQDTLFAVEAAAGDLAEQWAALDEGLAGAGYIE